MIARIFFFIAALMLISASALRAQDASLLAAGTRVKLVTPSLDEAQQTGRVVAATRDTITFRPDAHPVTMSLAVADITWIGISGGKETHRGRDALYGAAVGGALGAVIGAVTHKKPAANSCYFACPSRGADEVLGAVLGGAVGALVGAFVVANFDQTDRWVPISGTRRLSLAPSNGGLALSYKF